MNHIKLFEEFSRAKKIVFVGDIMQHPDQLRFEKERGFSYEGVFDELKDIFQGADMVIGNLETTVDENLGEIKDRTGKFKVTPDFIKALKDVGFTHLGVVNNHMYDYDKEGYEKTIKLIEAQGIKALRGMQHMPDYDIFTFTTHINDMGRLSEEEIKDMIAVSKDDKLGIAFAHWGDQYNVDPTREQERIAEYLDGHGYNLVIGSGTHIYNDTIANGNTIISYSLGDFISDHQKENTTNVGKILVVETEGSSVVKAEEYLTETLSDNGASRVITTGHNKIF